jgi:hypothetical protein
LVAFDGVRKMGLPPLKVIVVNICKEVELRAQWFASRGRPTKEDPAKRIEITKVSILFKLEYWKVLELLKLLKFLHELKFHST